MVKIATRSIYRKRKFSKDVQLWSANLIRNFKHSLWKDILHRIHWSIRIGGCSDTCEPSVEHLALDSREKNNKGKKEDTRAAVRRSISGALIGGGKAGKRYITVWHDGAPWSAIYWERTRLKPMINEPAWPRRKRSESGMTFPRFLPAYRFRRMRFPRRDWKASLSAGRGCAAVINRIEMYKIWSLPAAFRGVIDFDKMKPLYKFD